MQSHNLNLESDDIERDIEVDNFDKVYTNSDRRVDGEAINHEYVNRYEALAVDAHQPSETQLLEHLENASSTYLHPDHQQTNPRYNYQGLGQLSQDREFFQGFQPSSYRPRQSDRRQSQHPGPNDNHYFDQRDQQIKSYDHQSTFLSDSEEMFQENFKRFRRKPETNTYLGSTV